MAAFSQMTFSRTLSWIKTFQLITSTDKQVTRYYLKQYWHVVLTHICVTRAHWFKKKIIYSIYIYIYNIYICPRTICSGTMRARRTWFYQWYQHIVIVPIGSDPNTARLFTLLCQTKEIDGPFSPVWLFSLSNTRFRLTCPREPQQALE